MAFNLRIVFTGVCLFVPNLTPNPKTRMCVVLPDGRSDKTTIDDNILGKLRRHFAFISYRACDQTYSKDAPRNIQSYYDLSCQAVTFNVNGERFKSDLHNVADLTKIIPNYEDIDPRALSDNPPRVVAQFLINSGRLTTPPNAALADWVISNAISKSDPTPVTLAHEVYLDFNGISSAELIITPFGGKNKEVLPFQASNNENIEITVANLCDDNPLRRKTKITAVQPDYDFAWHYFLLTKKRDIANKLWGLPFPVPQAASGQSNGQGMNCLPAQTKGLYFTL